MKRDELLALARRGLQYEAPDLYDYNGPARLLCSEVRILAGAVLRMDEIIADLRRENRPRLLAERAARVFFEEVAR